ncbi:MAG: cupin domain-containing protein [Cyanobacteria bacterium P01_H01_bin.105]
MPTSVSSASEWPVTKPLILTDLFNLASQPERISWQPFRPGVEIHRLYGDGQTGSAAALLKYEPGAQVPFHDHTGYEHIVVLSGAQQDHHGSYTAGTLVINPPETSHAVVSDEGCIVLIIWERPVLIRAENSP